MRCRIWELLRKLKAEDVALIISTNRMDEADALADRVIVIADGTVQAAGSLQSLRQQYLPGYRLFVVCAQPEAEAEVEGATATDQAWSEVEDTLRVYSPTLTDDQRMRTAEQRVYVVPSNVEE